MAKEKICGIYSICNIITGKYYVGESIDIIKRWSAHKSALKNNRHSNKHLQSSWNLYGENNFEFSILEQCDKEIRFEKEKYWVNKLDSFCNGYNRTEGGDDFELCKYDSSESESVIDHRSISKLSLTKEQVLKIIPRIQAGESSPQIAKDYNVSTKVIDCIRHKNTWVNLTQKLDLKPYTDKKPVDVYTVDGTFINTYQSITIAAQETGTDFRFVSNICYGKKRYQTKGYVFRFHGHPFDEFKPKGHLTKAVDQYDKDWNYIKTFDSETEANNSIDSGRVDLAISKGYMAGGFHWLYHND